jgi:hypothetical protein
MCVALTPRRTKALPETKTDLMPRSVFLSTLMREPQPSRIMSLLIAAPSLRIHPENPDHHLWNNHGTWFVHYTVHPTPFTKQRVRASLGTKHLAAARERRDAFFAHLAAETAAGRISAPPHVAVAA